MSDKEKPPNPGSKEAIALGCKCPVLDNGHGKGSGWGAGAFWISDACPLHRRDVPPAVRALTDAVTKGASA